MKKIFSSAVKKFLLILLAGPALSLTVTAQMVDISYQTGFTSAIKKILPLTNEQFIVVAADGGVLIWNRPEKKITIRTHSSQEEVSDACIYRNYLLVAGNKGMDIFDLREVLSARQIRNAGTILSGYVRAISNGPVVRIVTGDGQLHSFADDRQLLGGTPYRSVTLPSGSISAIRESSGRLYLIGTHQQLILDTLGKKITSSSHYCTIMYGYDFAGDNTAFVAREDHVLRLDFGAAAIRATPVFLKGAVEEELVQSVRTDSAGRTVFIGTNNQRIVRLAPDRNNTTTVFYKSPVPSSYTSMRTHGEYLLCGNFFGNVEVVDIKSGKKTGELEEDPTPELTGVYLRGNREMITTHFGSRGAVLRFWNLSSASLQQTISLADHIAHKITFSESGDTLFSHHTSGAIYRYRRKDNLYIVDTIKKPEISFFSSAIVFRFDQDQRSQLEEESKELRESLNTPGVHRYTVKGGPDVEWSFFNPEGFPTKCNPEKMPSYLVPDAFITAAGLVTETASWDVLDRDLFYMKACRAENAGEFMARVEKYQFDTLKLQRFFRLVKGIEPARASVNLTGKNDGTFYQSFSTSGIPYHVIISNNPFIMAVFDQDSIRIWDHQTNRLYSTANISGKDGFYYALNEHYLALIPSGENRVRLIPYRQPRQAGSTWISFGADQYVVYTPDGYYKTKGRSNRLNMLVNEKPVSFSSFDLHYNRPDLVLTAMGSTDSLLIHAYEKAFRKRLKRAGTNEFTGSDISLPELVITNSNNINYLQDSSALRLNLRGKLQEPNGRLHIWINEVPVLTKSGLPLKTEQIDTAITITLSPGENRIEAALTAGNGLESPRTPVFVHYKPATPPESRLYFAGIGVNRFADSTRNLRWSVKDIRDLTAAFRQKYGEQMVILDTLFDEKVTADNIRSLKGKLHTAGINDKVVIAYSGHGLLDKEFDYYLSTYNIQFRQPSANGLPYEQLEDLLDGIAPRRKLLLIDACHSGEVDKEEFQKIKTASGGLAAQGITTKGTITESTDSAGHIGMQNSFDLMQSLFINVSKGTGATIISAAAGTQFAQERGSLGNGVFTYAILEALRKQPGNIRISELKQHVSHRVEQLTNGLQQPTSRQETNEYDWEL